MKRISSPLAAVAAAVVLSAGLPAQAAVISVNFVEFTTPGPQQIDTNETYGIPALGTVVGNWYNTKSGINNLADSEGNATTVNLIGLGMPNSQATFSGNYSNTVFIAGIDDYTATAGFCGFTLTNLNATFPNGYKVILYVSGFTSCAGASISDGTTTYYYRPWQSAQVQPLTLTKITQTTDLGSGLNPIAQYAVFGDSVLLTANGVTFTQNTLYGGGSAFCGFQIVGETAVDQITRIWKGNLGNNWDTSTLNWTNDFLGATNYADGDIVVFNDAAVAASPTVNLTAARSPSSVTVDSTKDYTLTGSGIAGATRLTKKGSGSLTLSNPNSYSNNTVLTAGTLKLGASGVIPDGAGFGDVSVASGATLDLNGNSEGINGLSGTGTVTNTGSAATLTVGLDNDGGTFLGAIQGPAGLTKQGAGNITLTGASTHSGSTIVAQGTLTLSPVSTFSGSSALVVSNGATLAVSVTNGSGLATAAALTLNGGVALSIEYGNASSTAYTVPLATSGALNLSGVSQIAISGNNFPVGDFTLISYGSKTGTGSISSTPASLPPGMAATLSDNGSAIVLNVTTGSVQSLSYTYGDGGIWATNAGTAYWNLGMAAYTEYPGGSGDAVEFGTIYDGVSLVGGIVSVTTDVHPNSIDAIGNYTLTGAGKITGSTGLEMAGASNATFVLDTTNTYSGVTTVSGGTLQINNAGALGSTAGGTVVVSGGSLALTNSITLSGEPLTINGNGTSGNNGAVRSVSTGTPAVLSCPITLGSNARISCSGSNALLNIHSPITDNGSHYTLFLTDGSAGQVLRLNSTSNVLGNLQLYTYRADAGLFIFGTNNVAPSASLSVGGGLFDLNGTSQRFAGLLAGSEPTFGYLTNGSTSASTLTIDYSGTNTASCQSTLTGPINLVKEGSGVQSFSGGAGIAHSYGGTTTINGGVFGVSSDFSGVTNSFIVNNGGTLRGSGNTIGGPVTVNAGGTFYAGFTSNQVGTLTLSNDLTLGGNLIVAIDKDLSPSNDVVNVSGALTYGGTLTVLDINTNGTPFVVGDTFRVFKSGGSGSFIPPINFLSLSNNAVATFSFNDGELTVTSVGTATPVPLNYTNLGGGVLQFSWSGAFKLQYQTNTAAVGLKTNWVDYPLTTNPVNVTNNPAIPVTFFRLQSL